MGSQSQWVGHLRPTVTFSGATSCSTVSSVNRGGSPSGSSFRNITMMISCHRVFIISPLGVFRLLGTRTSAGSATGGGTTSVRWSRSSPHRPCVLNIYACDTVCLSICRSVSIIGRGQEEKKRGTICVIIGARQTTELRK